MGGRARSRVRAVAVVLLLLLPVTAALPPTEPVSASAAPDPKPVDPASVLAPDAPAPADEPPVLRDYGQTPLHFEPNLGQTHEDVLFLARAAGYTLFLTTAEAVFVVPEPPEPEAPGAEPSRSRQLLPHEEMEALLHGEPREPPVERVIRMRFVDANAAPQASGLDSLPGTSNYFLGHEPEKWTTDVPHLARVKMHDVWPGVDVVFYGTEGHAVQYDFVVAPGADPDAIRLTYDGADVELDHDGSLLVTAGRAALQQPKPYTYQERGMRRLEIDSGFVLSPDRHVSFRVDDHDPALPVVIDPMVLGYSTYLGGSGGDEGHGIAVDATGSAYITGTTTSTDYPVKNAYKSKSSGSSMAVVTKLTPGGNRLEHSTYLGGSSWDHGRAVAVDAHGQAHVVGWTESSNFPVLNALQPTRPGTMAAFLTKISASGNALVYSTYFGGSGRDFAISTAVDADGNAYITGSTGSSNFPVKNAFQPGYAGEGDAFVAKISPAGTSLVYSTFFGGSDSDQVKDIVIDGDGSAHITGYTSSPDLPVHAAFQTERPGGTAAFVTKLFPGGNALSFSTYLGGAGNDYGGSIAVSEDGSTYVTGYTNSDDFPTYNAFQPESRGKEDVFVTKFIPGSGAAFRYITYLGGAGVDFAADIALLGDGTAYVVGSSSSEDFPVHDAYQESRPGERAAFISRLSDSGNSLLTSSWLGGNNVDNANSVSMDALGSAYLTGRTQSVDFPVHDAYRGSYVGSGDAFATKMYPLRLVAASGNRRIDTRPLCALSGETCPGSTLGYSNDIAPGWPAIFTLQFGDLNAHTDRVCARDDTCGHWLKLGFSVAGQAPNLEGLEAPMALLYWRSSNGTWHPPDGLTVAGRVRHDHVTQTTSLEPESHILLPEAALTDASPLDGFTGPVLQLRLDPLPNPWDPDGSAWSLTIDEAQVQLVGRPALFLHGWEKDPHLTDYRNHAGEWQSAFIADLRTRAIAEFGQDPWEPYGEHGLSWFAYHAKQDYRDSAELEVLEQIRSLRGATEYLGKVDLVTHSMGGLVARSLVEPGARNRGNFVDKIVTMNTPHQGSLLANGYVRWHDKPQDSPNPQRNRFYIGEDEQNVGVYRTVCDSQGVCSEGFHYWRPWWQDHIRATRFSDGEPMLADFALRPYDGPGGNPVLERLHTMGRAEGVEYLLIAGRPMLPLPGPFSTIWLPSPHDGVVSFKSASYRDDPSLCKRSTELWSSLRTAHSYVTRDAASLDLAFGFLTGAASPCAGGVSGPEPMSVASMPATGGEIWAQPIRFTRPPADFVILSGPASAHVTVLQWEVSAAEDVTFLVNAPIGTLGGENLRIVGPDGRVSYPDGGGSLEAYWGVFSDDEFTDYLLVHVLDPTNGNWSVEIAGVGPETYLDAHAVLASEYELDVVLHGPASLLRPTRIEAALLRNGVSLTGVVVTGRVTSDEWERERTLAFRDDGQHPDRVAGDGVYTAEFTPELPGQHDLHVRAEKDGVARALVRGMSVLLHPDEAQSRCILMLARNLEDFAYVHVSDWPLDCLRRSTDPGRLSTTTD